MNFTIYTVKGLVTHNGTRAAALSHRQTEIGTAAPGCLRHEGLCYASKTASEGAFGVGVFSGRGQTGPWLWVPRSLGP